MEGDAALMAIVVHGGGAPQSAWREEEPAGDELVETVYELPLSKAEMQLVMRLRMLEAGAFVLAVTKSERGMWGLMGFEVRV